MRTLILIFCLLLTSAGVAAPRVVASIGPLHSLAAGVMAGVGEPEVLLPAGASPHSYSLAPSDARLLSQADLVVWIGPGLEGFLAKPLATLARNQALSLGELPGLTRLEADHQHDHRHEDGVDWHLWLDPRNAQVIGAALAERLGRLDPANAARYQANARALHQRLEALDRETAAALAPVRPVPYVVFHDGYRYFEARYGLNNVGAITLNPEQPVGARHLTRTHERIRALRARCVFREPQFEPRLVDAVIRGTDARVGVLDPLGSDLEPGPDAYFQLIAGLRQALLDCLSG